MANYYVEVGRVPGVYTSWYECERQVKGFSGAEYRKISDEEARALKAKRDGALQPLPKETTQGVASSKGDTVDSNDPPPWDV